MRRIPRLILSPLWSKHTLDGLPQQNKTVIYKTNTFVTPQLAVMILITLFKQAEMCNCEVFMVSKQNDSYVLFWDNCFHNRVNKQ